MGVEGGRDHAPIGLLGVVALDPERFERDSIVLNHRDAKGNKRQRSHNGPACHGPEIAITRQT